MTASSPWLYIPRLKPFKLELLSIWKVFKDDVMSSDIDLLWPYLNRPCIDLLGPLRGGGEGRTGRPLRPALCNYYARVLPIKRALAFSSRQSRLDQSFYWSHRAVNISGQQFVDISCSCIFVESHIAVAH